jgi:XTP/dITP diphosphohydrolase
MNLKLIKGMRLVVATHNPGKAVEIDALLDGHYAVVTAASLNLPEPDETESSFVGNAMLKARHAADRSGDVAGKSGSVASGGAGWWYSNGSS